MAKRLKDATDGYLLPINNLTQLAINSLQNQINALNNRVTDIENGDNGDISPPIVSGFVLSADSPTQISVYYSATDGNSVSGYDLDFSLNGNNSWIALLINSLSQSPFIHTGRSASTQYFYRLRARDADANLSAYSYANTTTPSNSSDNIAPSVPVMTAASNITTQAIRWNWNTSTDNVGVTGYDLQIATDTNFISNLRTLNLGNVLFYNDSGLNSQSQYYARVRAHDGAPNYSNYSTAVTATTLGVSDTTPPTVPSMNAPTNITTNSIRFNWNASSDANGVTGYQVQVSSSSSFNNILDFQELNSLFYTFNGGDPATKYYGRVRAFDAIPNYSAYSSSTNATTEDVVVGDGEFIVPVKTLGTFNTDGDSFVGRDTVLETDEISGKVNAILLSDNIVFNVTNTGYGGAALHNPQGTPEQDLINIAPSKVDILLQANKYNVLFIHSIWNDLYRLTYAGEYIRLEREYCAARYAAGWDAVIISAPWASNSSADRPNYDVEATSINVKKLVQWREYSSGYDNTANDPNIGLLAPTTGSSGSLYYEADELHPRDLARQLWATYVAPIVEELATDRTAPLMPSNIVLTQKSQARIDVDFDLPNDSKTYHYWNIRVNGGGLTNQIFKTFTNSARLNLPTANTTYQIEVQRVNIAGNKSSFTSIQNESTAPVPTLWTPLDLPNIEFWAKDTFQDASRTIPANATGHRIGGIKDESANGYHAYQTVDNARPRVRLNGFGSKSAWDFTTFDNNESTNQFLNIDNLATKLHGDFSIFMAFQKNGVPQSVVPLFEFGDFTRNQYRIFQLDAYTGFLSFDGRDETLQYDTEVVKYQTNICDNVPKILSCIRKGNLVTLRIDGVEVISRDLYLDEYTATSCKFGATLVGSLREPVVCSAALEGADLSSADAYFASLLT